MAWHWCALAPVHTYTDVQGNVVQESYDYPPAGTSLAVPCDAADVLLAVFLSFAAILGAPGVVQAYDVRYGIDWEALCMVTVIAIALGGCARLIARGPLRYLRNAHRTPPGTHTHATGPCAPRFMYVWSAIGHWPSIGMVPVIVAGCAAFGWVTRQLGVTVVQSSDHRALFSIVDAAGALTGAAVTAFVVGHRFLPWYFTNPRIRTIRDWAVRELPIAAAAAAVRREVMRQEQHLVRPPTRITHADGRVDLVPAPGRTAGDGFVEGASALRGTFAAVPAAAVEGYMTERIGLQVFWAILPFVVLALLAVFGSYAGYAVIGGLTVAFLLGLTGGAAAVAQGVGVGVLVALAMLGGLYAYRSCWRTVWEILRWLIRKPDSPYPVTVSRG